MVRWLVLFLFVACGAVAGESAPVQSRHVTATLVSDTDGVAAGQVFRLGLRLRMAPGWHVYWQNPGDAGVPPELTVTGATVGPIIWPTPSRQPEGPVMTYGYSGDVVLPMSATAMAATATGDPVRAEANWLVCEKICVPEEASLTLALDGPPGPSAQAPLFATADAHTPRPSPFTARAAGDGALTLDGPALSAATVRDAWFIPAVVDSIENPAPQRATVADGRVTLALTPGPGWATPLAGVVVLRDTGGQESAWSVTAAPGASAVPLVETILLAVLGGLILNLMPCVFPVLAMKAMAVARLSGTARGAVRREGVAYTLGVLTAFGALGLALIALRAAGGSVGWGFQLQSPLFVTVLAWVLLMVGLNLSGVFEVRFAGAGAGQGLTARGGVLGSYATGLLAVLVATPCTAPFMGAALAVALAAPAPVALLVFGALGLGFAAPFLALALVPGVARLLPRPGAWMDVLRGALAFPMYAAAAWLLWVISLQAGASGVLGAAAGAVLLAFSAWAWGQAQQRGGRLGFIAAGCGALAAVALLVALPGTTPAVAANSQAYTPARLAALRAEGRPVFVNMTAAWCVTCLVNERIALSPAAVQARFVSDVTYLKGDWTRRDPDISAFLTANGRDGVPLYVFYPPNKPGIVLPQILTERTVIAALTD